MFYNRRVEKKEAVLLINPYAGTRKKLREEIVKILSSAYEIETILAEGKDKTLDSLRKLSPEVVIVAGGDGTINSTLPYLLESGAFLGIIPFGSGNGLARNLHIPLNSTRAAQRLLRPKKLRVDVGIINEEIFFINVAGVGFDGYIAHEFDRMEKRGISPYVYAALKGYFKKEEFRYETQGISGEAFLIAFANFPQYGGEARIAPGANPSDGKMDVVFIKKPGLGYTLSNWPRLFVGGIEKLRVFSRLRVSSLSLEVSPPQPSHYDGEKGPLLSRIKLQVKKRAVKVFR